MKIPTTPREPELAADAAEAAPATAAALTALEPNLDLSMSAHDVAIAELRRLLAAWRRYEPGARLGQDAEELHQLRVTTRRIDATLGLFKRQLPRALVQAGKTTKAVLRTLGAARDLDVQLAELAQYTAQLPEQERATAEPLRLYLENERTRARARMVRALDSEPTRRWLEILSLAGTERAELQGTERALVVMPERVRRRYRKLRKSVAKLRAKSSMDDYHVVRRRAKQLRYATECGANMFGKPAEELLRALRRLQDRLGEHQDAHMAQNRLAALAADPASGLPPPTLFLMGRLAEHNLRVTQQARETLTRSWRKVRGKRWKALRARLAELRDSAARANGAALLAVETAGVAAGTGAPTPLAAPTSEPETRPLKH
jgi:CHAD domain-containing protein